MTTVDGNRATGAPIDAASPATPDPAQPSDSTPAADPAPSSGSALSDSAPSSEPRSDPTPRGRRVRLVAAAVLSGLVIASVGGALGGLTVLALRPPPPPPPASATDLAGVVAAVAPAVVRMQAGDPETGAAGTAVVLTPSGDVVTNEHLVAGQSTATLIAADGQRSVARVVASDAAADLAWLRVDGASGLPVARLAGPGTVAVGEDVVAIGNALNLEGAPTISRGVVSAVGRSTASLQGVIQTDAAISSGSSGGVLVDRSGTVIGLTTEALVGDPSVSVEDIAFAIPAERVTAVLGGMGLVVPPPDAPAG